MKKWGVMFVLLLVFFLSSAASAYSTDTITRITDFETDNVHILRLQNFSKAVVDEVGGLKSDLKGLEKKLDEIQLQIEEIKNPSLNARQSAPEPSSEANKITAQLVSLESEVKSLKEGKEQSSVVEEIPPLNLLLVLNILIFATTIAIFFFGWKNNLLDKHKQADIHAQLHLDNAARNAVKSGLSIDKIKQTFLLQGWGEERVERALQEAVKK